MTTLLSAFNNYLEEFVGELIKIIPEENDFKVFKNAIYTLRKVNPRAVHNIYKTYIQNYREKILIKDEQFFLDSSYSDIINNINDPNTSKADISKIIDRIKGYWGNFSENTKDSIWQYMQLLLKLSDKVDGK